MLKEKMHNTIVLVCKQHMKYKPTYNFCLKNSGNENKFDI